MHSKSKKLNDKLSRASSVAARNWKSVAAAEKARQHTVRDPLGTTRSRQTSAGG